MNAKRLLLIGIGIGLIMSSLAIALFTIVEADSSPSRNSSHQLELGSTGNHNSSGNLNSTGNFDRTGNTDRLQGKNGQVQDPRQANAVAVTVSPGMTAEEIADVLVKCDVIDDKAEFLDRVNERGVAAKFQAGMFMLQPKQTVEDIDKIIDQLTALPYSQK